MIRALFLFGESNGVVRSRRRKGKQNETNWKGRDLFWSPLQPVAHGRLEVALCCQRKKEGQGATLALDVWERWEWI